MSICTRSGDTFPHLSAELLVWFLVITIKAKMCNTESIVLFLIFAVDEFGPFMIEHDMFSEHAIGPNKCQKTVNVR